MSKVIKEGVKVLVIRQGETEKTGVVDSVIDLDEGQIFIIVLEDGRKIKASIEDLVPDQAEKPEEDVEEITISREYFSKIAGRLAFDESKKIGNPLLGFVFAMVLSKLEYKLFGDPNA